MARKPVAKGRRRSRVDVEDEADGNGLVARAIDRTFENPAVSGGLLVMALTAAAIVSNALFLQNGRHPDPLFMTRSAPPREATAPATSAAASLSARPAVAIKNPPMPRLAPRTAAFVTAPPVADPVAELTTASLTPADSAQDTRNNELVADIQRELARIGLYNDAIDGLPGSRTGIAIRAFETAAGIVVTGEPTAELLAALKQPLPPRETQSIAVASTEAAELNRRERARAELIAADERRQEELRLAETYKVVQVALNRIGYGPIAVDGTADADTLDAIRRFELDNGMPVTGKAGDALVARLFAIGAIKPG